MTKDPNKPENTNGIIPKNRLKNIFSFFKTIPTSSLISSPPSTNVVPSSKNQLPVSNVIKCKLCWDEVQNDLLFTLSNCHCSFCLRCTKEYVLMNIQEANVHIMECPDQACSMQGIFTSKEIEGLVDGDMFKKYKKLKLKNEIDLSPHQSFCPSRNCESIVTLTKQVTSKSYSPRPALCNKCGFNFCILCKEAWHEGISCIDNLKYMQTLDNFDGVKHDEHEEAQIKRCPFCFLVIEKSGGCAQVKCKRCGHIFCWLCLACLDRDALFLHFERGPCKNKLGHSGLSLVWRRVQAVTIFAGVGLLVMLASPIFLLAAPCMVYSKMKACKKKRKFKAKMMMASNSRVKHNAHIEVDK